MAQSSGPYPFPSPFFLMENLSLSALRKATNHCCLKTVEDKTIQGRSQRQVVAALGMLVVICWFPVAGQELWWQSYAWTRSHTQSPGKRNPAGTSPQAMPLCHQDPRGADDNAKAQADRVTAAKRLLPLVAAVRWALFEHPLSSPLCQAI